MNWSAQQYVAFESERTRPVRDLLAALPEIQARSVIDIGCGPGNSTELLAAKFPAAAVSGLDSSADMIEAARARLPEVRFEVGDIAAWVAASSGAGAGPYDVILANAVLHWLPDHETLFPELLVKLAGAGALAVQMPDNLDEPAHRLMRDVAAAGPWAAKLARVGDVRASLATPGWYLDLIRSAGCQGDIWRTTYYHTLAQGPAGVVEWFKGSGLLPFLKPLDATERAAYLAQYLEAVTREFTPLADGSVVLPFPRVFIIAVR